MTAVHNLGLPASERAKLVPARPGVRAATEADVVRAAAAEAPVHAGNRPRSAAHLSGFARA
jgi:hypothetical protein